MLQFAGQNCASGVWQLYKERGQIYASLNRSFIP